MIWIQPAVRLISTCGGNVVDGPFDGAVLSSADGEPGSAVAGRCANGRREVDRTGWLVSLHPGVRFCPLYQSSILTLPRP